MPVFLSEDLYGIWDVEGAMWACRCDACSEAGMDTSIIARKIAGFIAIYLPKIEATSRQWHLSHKMMTLILCEPRLVVKNELKVFKIACAWVKAQLLPGTFPTGNAGEPSVSM
jgi:hypothetical protein